MHSLFIAQCGCYVNSIHFRLKTRGTYSIPMSNPSINSKMYCQHAAHSALSIILTKLIHTKNSRRCEEKSQTGQYQIAGEVQTLFFRTGARAVYARIQVSVPVNLINTCLSLTPNKELMCLTENINCTSCNKPSLML